MPTTPQTLSLPPQVLFRFHVVALLFTPTFFKVTLRKLTWIGPEIKPSYIASGLFKATLFPFLHADSSSYNVNEHWIDAFVKTKYVYVSLYQLAPSFCSTLERVCKPQYRCVFAFKALVKWLSCNNTEKGKKSFEGEVGNRCSWSFAYSQWLVTVFAWALRKLSRWEHGIHSLLSIHSTIQYIFAESIYFYTVLCMFREKVRLGWKSRLCLGLSAADPCLQSKVFIPLTCSRPRYWLCISFEHTCRVMDLS